MSTEPNSAGETTSAERFSGELRKLRKLSLVEDGARRPTTDDQGFRQYKVSTSGQMTLPATARQRWGLRSGGRVAVADLGYAILIVPDGGWRRISDRWLQKDRVKAALVARMQRERDN